MNMKYILILIISIFCYGPLAAQSPMFFARSANGDMPVMLFPEKNGVVKYSYTEETDIEPSEVLGMAEVAMNTLSLNPHFKIEPVSAGNKTLNYKIEISNGSEPWGFDLLGSPLFRVHRDASVVKLRCLVQVIKGKYSFILGDFETNRNTIRGEAKNDGSPNIIQWNRVNSLIRERNKAVSNAGSDWRKSRMSAYDYNYRIAYECDLYAEEYNGLQLLIDNLTNVCSNNPDGLNTPTKVVAFVYNVNELANIDLFDDFSDRFVIVDDSLSLFAQSGSSKLPKIFISGGNEEYELAGQGEILKSIIADRKGFIVIDKDSADYVIDYVVDTSGRDKAIVTITDRKNNQVKSKRKGSSESASENIEVAKSLYESFLSKMLTK